jgi:hypothetical protein
LSIDGSHHHGTNCLHQINASGTTSPTVEQELEKTRLRLEEKNQENAYLKEIIE